MKIGGLFPFEALPAEENGLLTSLGGNPEDVRHFMSGRCGIYAALLDIMATDSRRVAYLPAYTCETVSGCFVKAGYRILYYDLGRDLAPRFDSSLIGSISVLLIGGYYGWATYDPQFVARCAQAGVRVIQDATQTMFSGDGISPDAEYVAGSLRKWFAVACGGFALRRGGPLAQAPGPVDARHVELRYKAIESPDVSPLFWEGELMLRQMYASQGSDARSVEIVTHYPVDRLRSRRRENFQYLLDHFHPSPTLMPVFSELPSQVCPLHFPVYAEGREEVQKLLRELDISATVYWPVPPFIDISQYPGAQDVYDHILSIPCDQRYTPGDMERICQASAGF